jgi:hypothetical protein
VSVALVLVDADAFQTVQMIVQKLETAFAFGRTVFRAGDQNKIAGQSGQSGLEFCVALHRVAFLSGLITGLR